MLNTLSAVMDKFHTKIHATKPKTMTDRKDQATHPIIKLNNIVIQEVEQFCYLGSTITYYYKSAIDIKKRIQPIN